MVFLIMFSSLCAGSVVFPSYESYLQIDEDNETYVNYKGYNHKILVPATRKLFVEYEWEYITNGMNLPPKYIRAVEINFALERFCLESLYY